MSPQHVSGAASGVDRCATLRCREGVIYVRAMSALRRVLRLEIPACFKNITNPERPELGRSVNGRGSSQQGFSSVSIGARFSGLS